VQEKSVFDDRVTNAIFPPAKRWAYLSRAKTIRVATTNADGTIYLSPLWFAVLDRRLFLVVDSSRHGENFTAGRQLALLVDQGEEYRSISGLQIYGTVRPVEDSSLIELLPELLFEKYFHTGHPHAASYFEFGEWAGRQYFEVMPEKMVGWDSREATTPQGRERHLLPHHVTDRRVQGLSERAAGS
jgi:nitroimidazol reductase NimA-like FMN-containing flavoprotein (pyridoxamine 5'-phosphate oxidase superfamily)